MLMLCWSGFSRVSAQKGKEFKREASRRLRILLSESLLARRPESRAARYKGVECFLCHTKLYMLRSEDLITSV